MFIGRRINLLAAIIIVVALPTVVTLAWHYLTNDPTFRPLGITKADMIKQDVGGSSDVIAHVRWDSAIEPSPSHVFTQSLIKSFSVKGVALHVVVEDNASNGTTVVFQVGASRIGPYPKDTAVKGVTAAVTAYRMLADRSASRTD